MFITSFIPLVDSLKSMAAAMAVLNHAEKKKQESDEDGETDILLKIPDENVRRYDITMDLLLRG